MRFINLRDAVSKAAIDGGPTYAALAATECVLREFAGEWCLVTFEGPSSSDYDAQQAVLMPRHAAQGTEWRFTHKRTGVEWFIDLGKLIEVERTDEEG